MTSSATSLMSAVLDLPAYTCMSEEQLRRLTDAYGTRVLDGEFDYVMPVTWDPVQRFATRLHADPAVDVWLISWTPHAATELHDHNNSLGALTVINGALTEHRWTGDALKSRTLRAGDQASFPRGWIHDVVRSDSQPVTVTPTLSVHAYSPPLSSMSYYAIDNNSRLQKVRTERTDVPEKA